MPPTDDAAAAPPPHVSAESTAAVGQSRAEGAATRTETPALTAECDTLSLSVATPGAPGCVPVSDVRRLSTAATPVSLTLAPETPSPPPASLPAAPAQPPTKPRIRIVPYFENARSLYFDAVLKEVDDGTVLKIGRFTERVSSPRRITFMSKVVSRAHAEIWWEDGQFFIKDTKSSSGTFLNNVRLSPPKEESQPLPLKDGDVIQLGMDFKGGTEDIHRCVKIRLEINRHWLTSNDPFRKNALRILRAVRKQAGLANDANTDCCTCLCTIAPFQALFKAPCSHTFHYKCAQQLLMYWPAFTCPLCRTFTDLAASVSTDDLAELLGVKLDLDDDEDESGEGEGMSKTAVPENPSGIDQAEQAFDPPPVAA